jgi:hypothetical protein
MLYVTIRTKPITRFFRFIRVPFFYVSGGNFRISACVKNIDSTKFQGGKLSVNVISAFGQLKLLIEGRVKPIDPKKEVEVDFEGHDVFGVLANGHALFFANVLDNANTLFVLCDEKSKALQKQELGYHVQTFHSLAVGEFFSLAALMVNSIAFIANIILITYVNREKLSDIWNILQNYIVPIAFFAVLIILLWIVFVYVLYDRYGL